MASKIWNFMIFNTYKQVQQRDKRLQSKELLHAWMVITYMMCEAQILVDVCLCFMFLVRIATLYMKFAFICTQTWVRQIMWIQPGGMQLTLKTATVNAFLCKFLVKNCENSADFCWIFENFPTNVCLYNFSTACTCTVLTQIELINWLINQLMKSHKVCCYAHWAFGCSEVLQTNIW